MASKCISKLARLQHSSTPLSSLHLQMYLQTPSSTASNYILKFTRSWYGEMAELSPHPKGICEKEPFGLEEHRKMVRGYEVVPGHDEPRKLRVSMNPQQEGMGPRAGNDKLCISYNEMISIYPVVSQKYTPRCLVHLRYLCISVRPFAQSVFVVPVSSTDLRRGLSRSKIWQS